MSRRVVALAWTLMACGDPGSVPGSDGGSVPGPDAGADAGGTPTPDADLPEGLHMVYVGGSEAKIYAFVFDPAAPSLTPAGSFATGSYPSFLAFDPGGRWLVAVNEADDQVESYTITAATGALTKRDEASSQGGGPAHVALDRSGAWVLIANYGGGSAVVLPISAAGDLGAPAATVSPGANAHQIVADGENGVIYVPCKGDDHVAVYGFNAATGALAARPSAPSPGGSGPRHLALAPDGDHAYVVNELDSTISVFSVGAEGALTSIQTVTTLPAGFGGSNTTAEIEVHPSGQFVYASNRGHDSIAIFTVGGDGKLTPAGHAPSGGDTPRHFSLAAGGAVLLVANQSGPIHGFRVDGGTGALTSVGQLANVVGAQFVGETRLPLP